MYNMYNVYLYNMYNVYLYNMYIICIICIMYIYIYLLLLYHSSYHHFNVPTPAVFVKRSLDLPSFCDTLSLFDNLTINMKPCLYLTTCFLQHDSS